MDLMIRRAESTDIQKLAENVKAMALESSQCNLDIDVVLAGVTHLFNKPDLGFYIVAEKDNKIVGSLVIVYEWSDWWNGLHWWIHSVYIDPKHRRQGIYGKMYEFIVQEAKNSSNAKDIKLSTSISNLKARETYERNGMKDALIITYYAE